jgi:hypothetical protein
LEGIADVDVAGVFAGHGRDVNIVRSFKKQFQQLVD